MALQYVILPLGFIDFFCRGKQLFLVLFSLTFKGQGHVLPNFPVASLFLSIYLKCWVFKVLCETGKFSVLGQLL